MKENKPNNGKTKIKFCGLTRQCDIEAANEIRPYYIGFVFAKKSSRYISPEKAAELKERLAPEIKTVGVFVNETPEKITELMNRGIIDIAQLHGDEDEAYILKLRKNIEKIHYSCIRQIKSDEKHCQTCYKQKTVPEILSDEKYQHKAHTRKELSDIVPVDKDILIIKAFRVKTYEDILAAQRSTADCILLDAGAGDGTVFDWSLIKDIKRPYFLAGGLTPENARIAVKEFTPFAVDVSSGIETDGVKDPEKMKLFASAVCY